MRLTHVLMLAVPLVAGTACRTRDVAAPSQGFTAPARIDFGAVPLNEAVHRDVELTSTGRVPLVLSAAVGSPFGLDRETLELPGGATVQLRVTLRPVAIGAIEAELTVSEGDARAVVLLTGTGVDACRPADACHGVRFDEAAARCEGTVLAAGTACSDSCVAEGTCQAGLCVGMFQACDDGDACTVDACSVHEGCIHPPRSCAVSDPCKVARCDPQLGCVADDVSDGTVCGEGTCLTARVCINGACVARPTPNGISDCTYTGVCSMGSWTCASTVSERLRCWGMGSALGSTEPIVSPFFVPGADHVRAPVCGPDGAAWLSTSGQLLPVDTFAQNDAGLGRLVKVLGEPSGYSALDEWGVAVSRSGPRLLFWTDGGAIDIAPNRTVVLADGGVLHRGTRIFPGLPAPRQLASNIFDSVVGLFDDGSIRDGDGFAFLDGGATAVGGSSNLLCWSGPGPEVTCTSDGHFQRSEQRIAWPDPPASLTSFGLCGLSDAGRITCWGSNEFASTSDRSVYPEHFVRLGDGGFSSLWLRGDELLIARPRALIDGGPGPSFLDAGESTLVSLGRFPGVTAASSRCVLQGAQLACWSLGAALHAVSSDVTALCANGTCGLLSDGGLVCDADGPTPVTGRQPCVEAGRFGCALRTDGGVTCNSLDETFWSWPAIPVPLPGPASMITDSSSSSYGGCALIAGEAWCWGGCTCSVFDAGIPPATRLAGLRKPIRQLYGHPGFGCAVSGQNGLQCWDRSRGVYDIAVPGVIREIGLGGDHQYSSIFVLLEGGELLCQGGNLLGQLGFLPNTGQHAVPVVR